MPNFTEFLHTKVLGPRLDEHRIVVIFDHEQRYESVCDRLADDKTTVIKAIGKPLSSRTEAMSAWQHMAADTSESTRLLIYTQDEVPVTKEAKVENPFSAYVAMGGSFPDRPSDQYQQLCLSFLPERRTELDQLFEGETEPDFENIDSLAEGAHSRPRLKAAFGTEEPTRIIKSFLMPNERLQTNLDQSNDWISEFRNLMDQVFGLSLSAQVSNQSTIREKLWQFLLFSEFVYDLPCELPDSLSQTPKANNTAIHTVMELCEEIRRDGDYKEAYRTAAQKIEKSLGLADEFSENKDLGKRDTFEFEEKQYLKLAVSLIKGNNLNAAKEIHEIHSRSLWTEEGERNVLWEVLNYVLQLFDSIANGREKLKHLEGEGSDLINLYSDELSRIDAAQRDMDISALNLEDAYEEVEEIVTSARSEYVRFVNELQDRFLTTVQHEGWPFSGIKSNKDTYAEAIAPLLRDGNRVIYFLMDALRLEAAQNMSESLGQDFGVDMIPVCTQLPCVTRFGMASLIPGAEEKLRFEKDTKGVLQPFVDGEEVGTRSSRLKAFERHKGDRVKTFNIDEFEELTKTEKRRKNLVDQLNETDLVVVTSVELDGAGEGRPWMRQFISEPINKLMRMIRRASEIGMDTAVVATDHGFLWIEDAKGLKTTPPRGEWVLKKRRCYLGKGDESQGSVKLDSVAVGIPCDEPAFVVPSNVGVFTKGNSYFHEGLTLQESVVGRLIVHLKDQSEPDLFAPTTAKVEISRKRKTVSGLIVSVTLSWPQEPALSDPIREFEIRTTQGKKTVGFPSASENVDATTSRVRMKNGEACKVTIRLDAAEVSEGSFKVAIFDPKTEKQLDKLDLEYTPIV